MSMDKQDFSPVVDKRAIGRAWQWNGDQLTPFDRRDVRFEHIDKSVSSNDYFCTRHGYSTVCDECGCTVNQAPPTLLYIQGSYTPITKGDWLVELPIKHSIYLTTIKVVSAKGFDEQFQAFDLETKTLANAGGH